MSGERKGGRHEGVIRSHVLPGFQFRRENLLREPILVELARHNVYADYVIPELLVAETRVEKAEERADAAAAARRAAEEDTQALKAELARLRQQRS